MPPTPGPRPPSGADPHASRKRLEAFLLERRVVTATALQEAVDRQWGAKRTLVEVLVEQGAAEELPLAKMLAEAAGVPCVDGTRLVSTPDMAELVPAELAHRQGMLPLSRQGDDLSIAVVDPLDDAGVHRIAQATGLRVRTVCAPASTIRAGLGRLYGAEQDLFELLKHAQPGDEAVHPLLRAGTGTGPDASVRKLLDFLLTDAVRQAVAEIRITPEEDGVRVSYRIGGVDQPVRRVGSDLMAKFLSNLKQLGRLDPRSDKPQEGRTEIRVAGRIYPLRVAIQPGPSGDSLTLALSAPPATPGTASPAPMVWRPPIVPPKPGPSAAALALGLGGPPAPAPSAAVRPASPCTACGAALQAGWRHCPTCGASVPEDRPALALVCDDQQMQRKMLAAAVAPLFREVAEAAGGEEALRAIDARMPDVLIVDQVMPGLSGIDLIRILRGRLNTVDLPIVMVTAAVAEQIELSALEAGADDHIRKPVTPERLRARVGALLRSRGRRRS